MANATERRGKPGVWAIVAVGLAAIVWLVWPTTEPPPPPPPPPEPEPEAEVPGVVVTPREREPRPTDWVDDNVVEAGDEDALEESRTQVRLYRDAQVKALYDNRTLRGVQINGVSEGSFWDRLGVRDGDVVLEVNGELVDDSEAAILLMNSLSRSEILTLRVRGLEGDERHLEYRTPLR